MITDTTICVFQDIFDKLDDAAERTGTSRSRVVSSLVNYASKKMRKLHGDWIRTRYQPRRADRKWRRMHIRVRRDEYGFFFDMKKVSGLSLSHIIAHAVEHYLDELLILMQKNTDNYRYRNYAINQIFIDDIECWVIYWGIPSRIITHPPPLN